jgi:hypothetical protein
VELLNGDLCHPGDWVIWDSSSTDDQVTPEVGRVVEILQVIGSTAESHGLANWILIQLAIPGDNHATYGFPTLHLSAALVAISKLKAGNLCILSVLFINITNTVYQVHRQRST